MSIVRWLKGCWRWVLASLPYTGGLVVAHDDAIQLRSRSKSETCATISTLCPTLKALSEDELIATFRQSRYFTMLVALRDNDRITCKELRHRVFEAHGLWLPDEELMANALDLWRGLGLVEGTGIEKHTLEGEPTGEWTPAPGIGLTSNPIPRLQTDPFRGVVRESPPLSKRTLNSYVTVSLTDKGKPLVTVLLSATK